MAVPEVQPAVDPVEADPRLSRRSWMAVAVGAVGVVAAQAIVPAVAVAAAPTVKLGESNSINKATTIRHTASSSSAKAFTGRTTYTGTAGTSAGVQGISDGRHGTGVMGIANKGADAYGVWGRSTTGTGTAGTGPMGVHGGSTLDDGIGVMGEAGVLGVGVLGVTDDDGTGLVGVSGDTIDSVGVYGTAGPTGWAAFLDGDVFVSGEIFLPELTLQVDHPAAPGERWYRRSAVGSFERLSVVSGNTRTDASGVAVIEVPDLFARFHRDFRYQLTTIGAASSAHVSRELRNGRFTITTDRPRVKVSWQLTAVRDDPSARASEFRPSVAKQGTQRGRFLEPKVYDKSARRSIGGRVAGGARRPGRLTSSKERANLDG